jgi:hypothetical protein
MRRAAGVMLIIVGVYILVGEITILYRVGSHLFALSVFPIILAALIVTGGFFCIRRRYWVVCLVSALIPVYFVIRLFMIEHRFMPWEWVLPILAILPVIFIGIKRKEWKEILG